ncbi:MAG: FtsQ-type POTRA domain-containing protein [Clostridia bacterium]|nr:FtsQ-type POTRA domain-containing protein [Clostridia bacterium]
MRNNYKGMQAARSGKRSRHSSAGQTRKEKRDIRNSRHFGMGYAILTFFAVFFILVFAFVLFFKTETVVVNGNEHYSDQEVLEASGLSVGDNLYLFNKYGRIDNMFGKLSYLEEVRIRRKLPGTITIEVVETSARLAVHAESGIWLISPEGKILEEDTSEEQQPGLSNVYGLQLEKAKEGILLDTQNEQGATALCALLEAVSKNHMLEKLGDVDLTAEYDIQFTYDNRFLVSTGMPENLERKMIYLEEMIRKLSVTDVGYIELGGDQLRFIPSEKVPVLNTESKEVEWLGDYDTSRVPTTEETTDPATGEETSEIETDTEMTPSTDPETENTTLPEPETEQESQTEKVPPPALPIG